MHTNNSTQYTPTPWHLGLRRPNSRRFVYAANGAEVADCDHATNFDDANLENAKFIVRACNAHDDLVAALGAMLDAYEMDATHTRSDIRRFRAALAKAKGEQ